MTNSSGQWRFIRALQLPIAAFALVIANVFLAVSPAQADSHRKPCYFTEGSSGCVEMCMSTCYFCHCGGSCQETGGCEYNPE